MFPKNDVWQRANQETFVADLRKVDPNATGTPVQLLEYETLLKKHAVSAMDHDQGVADVETATAALRVAQAQVESDRQSVEVAKAAIEQAEASLDAAKINLGYTKITAPIAGRIGRSNVTDGSIDRGTASTEAQP